MVQQRAEVISNRVGLVRALDSFLLPTDQRNESDKNSSVSMALLAAGIWNKEMDSSQRMTIWFSGERRVQMVDASSTMEPLNRWRKADRMKEGGRRGLFFGLWS